MAMVTFEENDAYLIAKGGKHYSISFEDDSCLIIIEHNLKSDVILP